MGKLIFFGIGPRMAIFLLPWLFGTIILSSTNNHLFAWTTGDKTLLYIAGIVLMATGLVFYFYTARLLIKGLKAKTL